MTLGQGPMKDDYNYTETAYSRRMEGQEARVAVTAWCPTCGGTLLVDLAEDDWPECCGGPMVDLAEAAR